MRYVFFALLAAALVLPASAQESADLAVCKSSSSQQPKPDNKNYAKHIRDHIEQVNIPACTRVLSDKSSRKEDRLTAYHRRANYFAGLGRFDRARADANELMKLDPKRAETHILRASLLRRQKRGSDALESLTKSIAALPNVASLYLERGRLHDAFRRFDEAAQDYSKALKIARDQDDIADSRMALGRIFSRTGKLEDAISEYSAVIEIERRVEELGFAYTNRAEAYLYLKELGKAESDLKKMIEITVPDHPARYLASVLMDNIERQRREDVDGKR